MISNVEVEILKTKFNVSADLLLYLPFMYESLDEKEHKNKWLSFNEREHFVTIGNFRHAPNWDSVLYLKNSIWPIIRKKLQNTELHIYGSYLPKKAQQLHNPKQGFYIKGWAEDSLQTLSHYRVCLSPLRFGAGMKGKLADAMLTGTPSVTTEIGAESMYIDPVNYSEHDWPGFINESDNEIAESAIELYENETCWKNKQNNIFSIVNAIFNKPVNEMKFMASLSHVEAGLVEHRNNNFTGKMLRHHTMKSAMYMSQWIEVKNKLNNQ